MIPSGKNPGSCREGVIATLAELVSINSVNPNYPGGVGEAAVADYVEDFFKERGIETWTQTVFVDRPNVIARVPGRNPDRRIVLEAHLDTVSAEGMAIDPWNPVIKDNLLYGRGACDTKAGMAAMMHAVASLIEDGITPECDVLFAATVDEEYSYRGVVALCNSLEAGPVDQQILERNVSENQAIRADAAIVAEPTMLQPVIASKGLVRWKIETLGRASHSSRPELGANAIDAMARIVVALNQDVETLSGLQHPLLGPATCNVGVIQGGTQVNFVPDRCEIEIDRRMLPGESCDEVLSHYQNLIDSTLEGLDGVRAVMHSPMLKDLPLETATDSMAVKTMTRVLEGLGLDSTPRGAPFCSDASKFGALGIPSLILGPGSIEQAHSSVEFVECSQVQSAFEIYRKFMIEFN